MHSVFNAAAKLVLNRLSELEFRALPPQEVQTYVARCYQLTQIEFSRDYLMAGEVIGAFRDGVLIGGWALMNRPPYRCSLLLPPEAPAKPEVTMMENTGALSELTALWLAPEANYWDSMKFWFQLSQHVAKQAKEYIIYAHKMERARLGVLYGRAKPEVVWSGPVSHPQLKSYPNLTIGIMTRVHVAGVVLHNLAYLLARAVRGGKRCQVREVTASTKLAESENSSPNEKANTGTG